MTNAVFQITPDGKVIVQNGAALYVDTVANFAVDYGTAAPPLPEGVTHQIYRPGVSHTLTAGLTVANADPEWPFADDAIAAAEALVEAQRDRIAAAIEAAKAAEEAAAALAEATRPRTTEDVIAERQRRLALGFLYDFGDARGVHRIGTTGKDMAGWDEVSKLAQARISVGDTTPINIVTETAAAQVTPMEWQSVLIAAGAFRQPIWTASFVLQAQDPIPLDFASDEHWPANTAA